MKNIEQRNKKFFDSIARTYNSGSLKKWSIKTQKKAIELVNIRANSLIFDAGCGTGNLLYLLSQENKNLKLTGIDISPKMLEIARKKLKGKAKLMQIPIENINYKNKFDYLFSVDAFHHFSNQGKAIKNFHTALKKNGKLIIVDLTFGRILNWLFHLIEPGNSKMNSKKDFQEIFKRANFKNIKQEKISIFTIMTQGEKC